MAHEQVVTETRRRVSIVTLDRPQRMNALSGTMNRGGMREAIEACDRDSVWLAPRGAYQYHEGWAAAPCGCHGRMVLLCVYRGIGR